MEVQELRETGESEDPQVNQEEMVHPEDLEIREKEDPQDLTASLVRMELLETEGNLVHKGVQDHLAQEVSLVTGDRMDHQDHKVNLDHKGLKASQGLLDLQEKEESEDQMDHQATLDQQDLMEMQVATGQEDQMDVQDHRVHRENVVHPEKQDFKDLGEILDPEEVTDNQDRTGLMESVGLPDLRDQTADQVRHLSLIQESSLASCRVHNSNSYIYCTHNKTKKEYHQIKIMVIIFLKCFCYFVRGPVSEFTVAGYNALFW